MVFDISSSQRSIVEDGFHTIFNQLKLEPFEADDFFLPDGVRVAAEGDGRQPRAKIMREDAGWKIVHDALFHVHEWAELVVDGDNEPSKLRHMV